ncbi:efflux transporter outer membrane subunit [Methylocella sp.]|uniref:efflux transporter outer membrane subunit n=1 Tax=Methylocella sp. TaxID=1978226 RepID=UPI003784FCF9
MARRKPLARTAALALAALAAPALSGCVVGPDFAPPDPGLPQTSFFGKPAPAGAAAAPQPAAMEDAGASARWWRSFNDPTLSAFAEEVASANLDVAAAGARIAQSRAQLGVAASAAIPAINGQASYQRDLYSQNGVLKLAGPDISAPPISVWQTGLDASWELDLWGRVARSVESADAALARAEFQRRDALVSALAELARDYISVRGAQAQVAILNENLKSAKEALALTKTRTAKGLTSQLDVENAAALVASIEAQIPALQNDAETQANALALLLAREPGAFRSELARKSRLPSAPRPPLGAPFDLARRRPDIRAAEAELHAATADVGVAVADFYPSLRLNGNLVVNALDARQLFRGSSLQYQFGPSVSLPIFEGGRLKSTLEMRTAQQREAAISYRKTVLTAWREVVDAFNAYGAEELRRVRLKAQVAHARQALSIAHTRYDTGVLDFLNVLDAQRTMLRAMQEEAQSATSASLDLVQLYKALGGGWGASFPEAPEPQPPGSAL